MKPLSKLRGILVILTGCVIACLVFLFNAEPSKITQAVALSGYPAPDQAAAELQTLSGSSNPYPPPPGDGVSTQIPAPTIEASPTKKHVERTPVPTIPGTQSLDQAVPDMIASSANIKRSDLVLVEATNIEIPFTGKKYWYGRVVNISGEQNPIYDVMVDVDKRMVAGNDGIDPKHYWQEAEKVFSQAQYPAILQLASSRFGEPVENLKIINGIFDYYSLTETVVWKGKLLALKPPRILEIATDLNGKLIDLDAIQKKEDEARRQKFGKLDQSLYYYLQAIPDDRPVDVLVWVKDIDYDKISQTLDKTFPSTQANHFANGMLVDSQGVPQETDKKTAKAADKEYRRLVKEAQKENKKGLMADLKNAGYSPVDLDSFPAIAIKLNKKEIETLGEKYKDTISVFYLNNQTVHKETTPVSIVTDTIRTNSAWNMGWQGNLAAIGIGDFGVVRTDNPYPALAGKVAANLQDSPNEEHPVAVAGVLAGYDPGHPYQGVAYGNNQLYSTRIGGADYVGQLTWLADNTDIANFSISFDGTQAMQASDRVFDYISRYFGTLFVVATGNYDSTLPSYGRNVRSPAKGFNIISVGGFDAQGDSAWGNDVMSDSSCYVNPFLDGETFWGDREKPEVVAVGKAVESVNTVTGSYKDFDGTSFAAPQVTGLAALLIDADWFLYNKAPLLKAIIMASAIHNIEGDQRLSDQDGAGGIDVASAMTFFQTGGYTYRKWLNVSNTFSTNGGAIVFSSQDLAPTWGGSQSAAGGGRLYAEKGERVRAVISWESNPNAQYTSDILTTDLDLMVLSPSGNVVATSIFNNNNFEIVDFVAEEAGDYQVVVTYYSRGTEASSLGFGLSWIRNSHIYFPLVMK